jgi:hypothetical protein
MTGVVLHLMNENGYQLWAELFHFATKNLHITITKFVNNFSNFYQKSPISIANAIANPLIFLHFFTLPTLSILLNSSSKSTQNPCRTRLFTIHTHRFTCINPPNHSKILVISTFFHIPPTLSR